MPNTYSKLASLGQHGASASVQAKVLFKELIVRYANHRTTIKRLVLAALLASTINRIRGTINKSSKMKSATKDTKLKDKVEVGVQSAAELELPWAQSLMVFLTGRHGIFSKTEATIDNCHSWNPL
jgi:hypothetical protein